MIMQSRSNYVCFECDSEFIVENVEETELDVSFCPYCGSELDMEDEEDEDQEEDCWD